MPTFAGRSEVGVDELVDAGWIATPSSSAEPLFGVWPGLPGRQVSDACHRVGSIRLRAQPSWRPARSVHEEGEQVGVDGLHLVSV